MSHLTYLEFAALGTNVHPAPASDNDINLLWFVAIFRLGGAGRNVHPRDGKVALRRVPRLQQNMGAKPVKLPPRVNRLCP